MPHCLLTFAALAVLLASSPLAAEEANDTCMACHGIEGFAGPDDRPLYLDAAAFADSAHQGFECTTCHADAATIPHPEGMQPPGLQTCALCHGDEVEAYESDIHGRARTNGATQAPTCKDCHGGAHQIKLHTVVDSPVHPSHLAATCAHCHGNADLVREFRIPVVRPLDAYLKSAHARAVAEGKRGAVCSSCHRAHGILPGSNPQSSVWHANIPATCGHCHAEILTAYRESVHGQALANGVREAPVCSDCHGEHTILGHSDPESPVYAANVARETCSPCHANERLNAKYGLDAHKVTTYQDSFHGLSLRGGQVAVANCSSCHGVHNILPSTDPRSKIYSANLPQTCGTCHPGAGTRFALGPVHTAPTRASAWQVYWVRFVYLWLIGLVIGFMVLHNLLDLARKMRRGEGHPPPPPPPDTPERMPRALRWEHGLVMLSFPVLVYTGFALTYPESWWASPFLRFEGQVPLRALIHRTAAVVLIVSLILHCIHLVISPKLRACLRRIFPSPRDFVTFFRVIAYYLGLRPSPPPMGQFSYIEKAEYWAFIWGMLLMTVTGFMLWFENTTLRYAPKWVTDVATAIHFYEAVLASLAILVWHLYWVIFDPEVYPMDWSWWTGKAPPSRVHERRSKEEEEEEEKMTAEQDEG